MVFMVLGNLFVALRSIIVFKFSLELDGFHPSLRELPYVLVPEIKKLL